MPFLTELQIHSIRGTDDRVLLKPLVWISDQEVKFIVRVPSGFKTNYASIPQFARGLIDNDSGQIRDAAVLHDYLYAETRYTRQFGDWVLRVAMNDLGAPWWKRWAVWAAVRTFGWLYKK